MHELRVEFLESNWEQEAKQGLLAMTQGDGTFKDFAHRPKAANARLVGTTAHLSKARLRQQLTVGMTQALHMQVNNSEANAVTDYKLWKEQVRRINDLLIQTYAEIQDVMKRSRNANRVTTPAANPARKNNVLNVSSSRSNNTSGGTKPLTLTAKEKILLMKYHRCFKCRRLNQKHQSRDCPNDFPSGVGYHELTLSDMPSGCKPEPERKTVAAVTHARLESPQPHLNVVSRRPRVL